MQDVCNKSGETLKMEEVIQNNTMEDNHKVEFIWVYRPHPLCIPHIVDNIQSYLNVSDLKSCRLVNSQYNEIACHNLARKEVITFNKFAQLSSYITYMPISSLISSPSSTPFCTTADGTNSTTIATMSTNGDDNETHEFEIPNSPGIIKHYPYNYEYVHTSFHFNFDPATDPKKDEVEKVTSFFKKFGPSIRELRYTTDLIPYNFPKQLHHMGDVWKGRMDNLETLSFEMKWGIPSCLFEKEEGHVQLPNVKKLILDILITEREADRADRFLRQLINSTPNVEEISIPGNKRFFDDYVNVVLGRVILSGHFPRLAHLNFCLALNSGEIRALSNKNLPLKSLILDFAELPCTDENNNDNANFLPLLQNQAMIRSLQALFLNTTTTLKDLHLCFPYNPAHSLHRFIFPESMINLSHLALGGFNGSVTILDKLPVIKKLDLWNVKFHDFDYESQVGDKSSGDESKGAKRFVPDEYLGITNVIS